MQDGGRRFADTERMTRVANRTVAGELIDAIAAQDWQRVEATFSPDVRLYAAVPSKTPLREHVGAEAAAAQIAAWFGDADPLELVESHVEPVGEKLRLSYRFRSFEEGRWHLVEQQAYCTAGDAGIEEIHLVCGGFQPLDG
jgi:hypothetical protein